MPNIEEVTRLLVEHATRKGGEELDLICVYGSRARGDAREDSDLDIFYVPADGANPPISRTFTLDGLLIDFWPIRWATLEGFATGEIRGWAFAPGLVHEARPIYARTSMAMERLLDLKQRVVDLQKPEAKPEMVQRAMAVCVKAQASLMVLDSDDITVVRTTGWEIINHVWESLSLLNQVFFTSGLTKALAQSDRFTIKPSHLESAIETIALSDSLEDSREAARTLVKELREVIDRAQLAQSSRLTPQEAFGQGYPELYDKVVKLRAACRQGNRLGAAAEAWAFQTEVAGILSETDTEYRDLDLPDLIALSSGDLEYLQAQARIFDDRLRRYLEKHAVSLNQFESTPALKAFLEQ